jgi:hypothetical protein
MDKKKGRNGFIDTAVVVLAILLFFRTADVLTNFAPPILNNLVGADISWLYAAVMAFFVEGIALAFHFDARAHRHTPAIIVKWVLLAISALCQVFDGNIIAGTVSQMSGPMKLGFQWGVPLLPIFVVVLLFFVGKLPEEENGRGWLDRLQDKGIVNYLPDPQAIWRGRGQAPQLAMDANALDVPEEEIENEQPEPVRQPGAQRVERKVRHG